MSPTEDVQLALKKLVHNCSFASDIAWKLLNLSIVGIRGNSAQCPIARYIESETGHIASAGNMPKNIAVVIVEGEHPVDGPEPIAGFIHCFDAGCFPFLEEK